MPGTTATDDTLDDELQDAVDADEESGAEPGVEGATDEDEQAGEEEQHAAEESAEDAGEGPDEEGLLVTIGDEAAESDEETDGKPAPAWLKDLRKANREKDRRIRELEAKIASSAAPAEADAEVGPEPELVEFADADQIAKYRADLKAWHERKAKHEAKQSERQRAEEAQRQAWQAKLDGFRKAASQLKVPDFEDAEEAFLSTLNPMQQGIVLKGAARPELLTYAIGKNAKELKRVAAITDPIEFAFAVAKIEDKIKTMPKKQAPAPERRVTGGGSPAAAVVTDKNLAKLQAQAQETGDYSKYLEAKRALKERMARKSA